MDYFFQAFMLSLVVSMSIVTLLIQPQPVGFTVQYIGRPYMETGVPVVATVMSIDMGLYLTTITVLTTLFMCMTFFLGLLYVSVRNLRK